MIRVYTSLDLAVFVGYFLIIVVIGVVSGRGHNASVSGYFRGDNRLPWYVIGFSIVAAGVSSEQFVGEMGYAYKIGMPTVNWEWLVIPALSILLWIFVPLYVRNRITTMPEYLEQRYGPEVRTLYAYLSIGSFVLVSFPLVYFTGGFALRAIWNIPQLAAVWTLAIVTGLYTIYGGLRAVAWTSTFQCVLLLVGGFYIFCASMNQIGWDFAAVLGTGERAHLIPSADHPDVPWTALVVLALSTNVWYYATNQYINQRCLAARSEWHAKMGVLFAGGLQVLLPLATCFPGMVYRVINPNLEDFNATYPAVVAAVVPAGLRGFVAAAIVGAIMSTISGLVNSTSTIVTLDIAQRQWGRDWSEEQLVRVGRWSGAIALLVGALLAPIVMHWDSIFRYAQDIWAPMAAPIVVVFLCAAVWRRPSRTGALACLWLSILTVPLTITKGILADAEIHFLPSNMENSLVLAGGVMLASWALMATLGDGKLSVIGLASAIVGSAAAIGVAAWSSEVTSLLVVLAMIVLTGWPLLRASRAQVGMWDHSMLSSGTNGRWFSSVVIWWVVLLAVVGALYAWFW
ncbi:MAG: sodium/solute symporter [Pirellulales bacterium]